jgi:hypothetical protein
VRASVCLSENDNHNDDGRAGLSRIEIYAYGLVQGKQGGLIVAKSDVGGCAVFEESHERDLNCFSGSIQDIAQLPGAPLSCLEAVKKPRIKILTRSATKSFAV